MYSRTIALNRKKKVEGEREREKERKREKKKRCRRRPLAGSLYHYSSPNSVELLELTINPSNIFSS